MDFNRLNLNWPYLWWLLIVFFFFNYFFFLSCPVFIFSCVGVGEYVCAKRKCFWLHQEWADAEGFG